MSKKLIRLLRSGSPFQDNDGAVQFWRIQENFQQHFLHSPHWSDIKWNACLAAGGGVTIVDFRALQEHSGRNLIDLSFQDNVIIQRKFFQCKNHVGCVINLHSIISSGLILGGQSFEQQTDRILSLCGSN